MTTEKDIVLIHFEDNPLVFARIESVLPDAKPDWYHVTLLMLQVPLQTVTWILRDVYISGETFTMNGKSMRLEKVEAPPEAQADLENEKTANIEKNSDAKVISFSDLKKD